MTAGINIRDREYTAQSISDAFSQFIPGHMDWPIKRQALERWNSLAFDLYSGPVEFDLLPVFHILDDFLFLRAIQNRWDVRWIDYTTKGRNAETMGLCDEAFDIRGPMMWINVTRPTNTFHRTVQEVLDTLVHEMCHALLRAACMCSVCRCQLKVMDQRGVAFHGPSWQAVMQHADETASSHLKGFSAPHWVEFRKKELERMKTMEAKAIVKMLGRLWESIKGKGTDAARLKNAERAKARAKFQDNTPENDALKHTENEALLSITRMFQMSE